MMSRLILIFLLLASVGLFFTVVDPTYKENQTLQSEKTKFVEALAKAQDLQAVRESLEAKVSGVAKNDIVRLERLLPNNVDNVRLVIDIEQIANRYGMTLSTLKLEKKKEAGQETAVVERQNGAFARQSTTGGSSQVGPAQNDPLQSLLLTFKVSSSYGNFLRFLKDLENSLRLIDIIGVSFSSGEADFFDFEISIRTYWLRS